MSVRWRLKVVILVALGMSAMSTGVAAAQDTLTVQCASASATGACDESGAWQDSSVTVTWEASPVPTQVAGCVSQTYTDTATTVSCQVWWGKNGTPPSESISFPLNVESSSPTANVVAARPPDANGWYNHPVAVSFEGSAFSGIAGCTPGQTYSGPNTPGATVAGSCTDNAGKTATASLSLPYDATPPTVDVVAKPGDHVVNLSWRAAAGPAPIASIQISRSPGPSSSARAVVYHGSTGAYRDTRVRNGVRYHYAITAEDQAGNVAVRNVLVMPGARLLSPVSGAHISGRPILSWTPVPRATYYNVQLYHGAKILSAWPKHARLRLSRTWRFAGHRHRLSAGRYRWYVWPGFGQRRAARYGHIVGIGTFVIR